jgi:hypothetical protein
MTDRGTWLALLAGAALATGGCGEAARPPAMPAAGDGRDVALLIDEVNEFKANAKKFPTLFAAGAAPRTADLKKYGAYEFYLGGQPAVNGDAATMLVRVVRAQDRQEAGQTEWTFVKEGNGWKIKAAPLP